MGVEMSKNSLFKPFLLSCGLLMSMPQSLYAAPLDDVSLQQQGDVVLATIKLTTPVHFLRYVPGEKSRIVEIYYERVPSSDSSDAWADREVRNSPATALTPAFTVTTRDQATQPKLVVEFASDVNFSVNAGGDSRSFVITIKPEKTATPVVSNAALPMLPAVQPPVVDKIKPAAGSPEAMQAENNQQGYALMLAGRDALSAKNHPQATEAFNKLLMLPPNQYSQDAQEWVGVARERDGQPAKAKVEYELYLKLYTTGPGVQAVKQRLAGLASPQAIAAQSQAPTRKLEPRSFVQGGISSRYYFGQSNFETTYQFNGASQTDTFSMKDQSSLITNVDAIGRYVSENYDNRVVYRDVATQNFLPGQTNRNRVNAAYVEVKNRTTEYSARLGRQTTGGGGVMGRFDGVYAGVGAPQDWRVNGVAGQLVDYTSANQPVFYGVSVDKGPVSVYLLNQTIEGVLDRRALGAEFRYFEGKKSAFSAVDYDIFYKVLNTLMLTGTYGLETGTTFNFMADYRRNLSTRNALNGATTTSVQDLLATMTEERLNQLALDRTASSTYSQVGVTQRLNQTWQVGGDVRLSKITGMPASGTTALEGILPGTKDTGLEKTLTAQLIASNLFSEADISTLGTSYFTSDYVQNGQSLFVYNRTSFGREFSLDTSWNFYRQSDNFGGSMSRHIPMVRAAYQVGQDLSLDADLGVELSTSSGSFQTTTNRRIFTSLGFRWNF
jgi:hypothetical protein